MNFELLPAWHAVEEILNICENDVWQVCAATGQTGTGKSSVLPVACANHCRENLVICAQPRQLAVKGCHNFVRRVIPNNKLAIHADKVGYVVGDKHGVQGGNKGDLQLLFTTFGWLAKFLWNNWQRDRGLLFNQKQLLFVFVDEAHELHDQDSDKRNWVHESRFHGIVHSVLKNRPYPWVIF